MRIDYLSINSFYLLFFLYCEFFMPLDYNQSGKWTMINIISIIIIKYNETYRFDNFSVRIGLFMEHNWINFKNNSKDNYLKIRCTRFEDFFPRRYSIYSNSIRTFWFVSVAGRKRSGRISRKLRTSFSPKLGQRNSISITAFQRIIHPRTNFEEAVTFVYVSIYSTRDLRSLKKDRGKKRGFERWRSILQK